MVCTQQKFVLASWNNLLKKNYRRRVQLAATCCFNLQRRNFVAWQCLKWVGNTCNNAFQLATQECCVASGSNLLLVLLHLLRKESIFKFKTMAEKLSERTFRWKQTTMGNFFIDNCFVASYNGIESKRDETQWWMLIWWKDYIMGSSSLYIVQITNPTCSPDSIGIYCILFCLRFLISLL